MDFRRIQRFNRPMDIAPSPKPESRPAEAPKLEPIVGASESTAIASTTLPIYRRPLIPASTVGLLMGGGFGALVAYTTLRQALIVLAFSGLGLVLGRLAEAARGRFNLRAALDALMESTTPQD